MSDGRIDGAGVVSGTVSVIRRSSPKSNFAPRSINVFVVQDWSWQKIGQMSPHLVIIFRRKLHSFLSKC